MFIINPYRQVNPPGINPITSSVAGSFPVGIVLNAELRTLNTWAVSGNPRVITIQTCRQHPTKWKYYCYILWSKTARRHHKNIFLGKSGWQSCFHFVMAERWKCWQTNLGHYIIGKYQDVSILCEPSNGSGKSHLELRILPNCWFVFLLLGSSKKRHRFGPPFAYATYHGMDV